MALGKRFTNLNVDFSTMRRMSVGDRVAMSRSSMGRQLMENLTPEQLASLFPRYYRKALPDIGTRSVVGTSSTVVASTPSSSASTGTSSPSPSGTSTPQSPGAPRARRAITPAGGSTASRVNESRGEESWYRRARDSAGVAARTAGSEVRLSREQSELYDQLRTGQISADDPRVSFLRGVSDENLRRAGIERRATADGKQEYAAVPTQASRVTDDAIRAQNAERSFRGFPNATIVYNEMRRGGYTHEQAVGMVGNLMQESGGGRDLNPRAVNRGDGRDGSDSVGIMQWNSSRARALKAFAEERGLDPNNIRTQAQFMVQEFGPNGAERAAGNRLRASQTVDESVRASLSGIRPKHWNTREDEYNWRRGHASRFAGAADPNSGGGANMTPEQIAAARARMEESEINQRKSAFGAALIPDLPAGVNPRIAAYYNTLSPTKKQEFHEVLRGLGNGEAAAGVARLNQTYGANPQSVGRQLGTSAATYSNSGVEQRASLLHPETRETVDRFNSFAPPGTVITSTYRDPRRNASTPGSSRTSLHTQGRAIDVRTNGRTPEQLASTIAALKQAGFTNILLENDHIHAERREGVTEFQGVRNRRGHANPVISEEVARAAAERVAFRAPIPEQRQNVAPERRVTEAPEPTPTDSSAQSRGLAAYNEQRRAALAPTNSPAAGPTQPAPVATQAAPAPVTPPPAAPNSSATDIRQRPIGQPRTSPAETATQAPPAPINAYAEGGAQHVNAGEIRAMPIQGMKSDNSVVVDENANPLFTMNTKRESAEFNPRTGEVSVQPRQKTDPNQLGTQPKSQDETPEPTETPMQNMGAATQTTTRQAVPTEPAMRDAVSLTESIFKDASFQRAIARTRFRNSGDDSLGGHFDHGASNMV